MTDPIIKMAYANVKTVTTRKVFQAVFEGPMEQMMEFLHLFGAPDPHSEQWAAIAPLGGVAEPQVAEPDPVPADRTERPLSQAAAILCGIVTFRRWLAEGMGKIIPLSPEQAADELRRRCIVASRRELDTNDLAAQRFRDMRADYKLWMQGADAA